VVLLYNINKDYSSEAEGLDSPDISMMSLISTVPKDGMEVRLTGIGRIGKRFVPGTSWQLISVKLKVNANQTKDLNITHSAAQSDQHPT